VANPVGVLDWGIREGTAGGWAVQQLFRHDVVDCDGAPLHRAGRLVPLEEQLPGPDVAVGELNALGGRPVLAAEACRLGVEDDALLKSDHGKAPS
jgi:hypothetical protein